MKTLLSLFDTIQRIIFMILFISPFIILIAAITRHQTTASHALVSTAFLCPRSLPLNY